MPEKLTTAPTSVRPLVRAAISRAVSKSACWMRMVTGLVMGSRRRLAAGPRREEGNFAGACDRRVRLDVGMIDRGTDHRRLLEGIGIGLALPGQPGDQFPNGANAGRRVDRLLGLADALAHP